jgi:3-hydroxybutyrate dehydrogenase
MAKFELQPPEITKPDILIVQDDNFKPEFVGLVTGASSGIGRATAIAMAANGLSVTVLDMDEAGGKQTVEMCKNFGGKAQFIKTDLSNDADIENCVKEAAKMGEIKFLANIAGLQHINSIQDFPMAKYDLMMSIMLRAPFYLSKLVMPHIKKSKNGTGAIANMSSIHGHIATMNKPVYIMSKFGIRALSQCIAAEGEGKIRGFSVSVGFIKTPLALKQIPDQAKQRGITEEEVVVKVMLGMSRIKEMMNPIEVANLFIFGFSKHGKYLVGNDLLFDGGCVKTYGAN